MDMAYIVSSGVTSSGNVLNRWDSMIILNGGTANNTALYSGGYLEVYSGGVANCTTITSYSWITVKSGGTATDVVWTPCEGHIYTEDGAIVSFANEYSGVYYGQDNQLLSHAISMTSLTTDCGNEIYVMSGGIVSDTTINGNEDYACSMYISSNGTAVSIVLNGSMVVSSKGTVNGVNVNSWGTIVVSSGGTATDIAWTPCIGHAYVSDGGYVTFASSYSGVYYGSNNTLKSSAVSMSAITLYQAEINVMDNGITNNIIVQDFSSLFVSSGGIANHTNINRYGSMYISSCGIDNQATVNSDGHLFVELKGTANSTMVNSGGIVHVSRGGTANNAIINQGGKLSILSGGLAFNIVENGGYVEVEENENVTFASNSFSGLNLSNDSATVHSGTTAINTIVNSGGMLSVLSGGSAIDVVENGGYVDVVDGANVSFADYTFSGLISGTIATVHSGTIASDVTIHADGSLFVFNKGTANSILVHSSGGLEVSSGGTANNTIVYSSGFLRITSGGTAAHVEASSGACLDLSIAPDTYIEGTFADSAFEIKDGIAAYYSVNSGNKLHVSSGGLASRTYIYSGGNLLISNGGIASRTVISGGIMAIHSAGIAESTTINNDGQMRITNGGMGNAITVNNESGLHVSFGGIADGVTISNEGCLYVSSGGTATNITASSTKLRFDISPDTYIAGISAGLDFEIMSGIVSDYKVNSGGFLRVYSGGTANNNSVNGSGYISILSGGIVNSTTINGNYYSSGCISISKGGVANKTTINSYGRMWIYSEGNANSTIINNGGRVWLSGGIASCATINNGGSVWVAMGGTANDMIVNQGGRMLVSSGGVVSNARIKSDGYLLFEHGKLTGQITIAEGGYVHAGQGAILDFDISCLAPGMAPRVNNLSFIQDDTPAFTLTVSDLQGNGTYVLAQGATEFDNLISVKSLSKATIRMLEVGKTINVDGVEYSLNLVDDTLSVVVTGGRDIPVVSVSADITAPTKQSIVLTADFREETVIREYSFDNETWHPYTEPVTCDANGTVYFLGKNLLGTISEWATFEIANIDRTAPEAPTASADITELTNDPVNVTAIFSEDSVVKEYTRDEETWQDYTGSVKLTENGTVYFRGIDVAGNISEITSFTVSNILEFYSNIVLTNESRTAVLGRFYDYTTIDDFGSLIISSGGVASNTTVNKNGSIQVFESGIADSLTVNPYGSLEVASGGTATNIVAMSGAFLDFTVASDTYIQGIHDGNAFEIKDASISGYTINPGIAIHVSGGGTALDITENGGYLGFEEDAEVTIVPNTIEGLVLSGGAAATVHSGTTANHTLVDRNGGLYVFSGGMAIGATVSSGGRLHVSSGGTATDVDWVPFRGELRAYEGAYVTLASQCAGVYYGSGSQLRSQAKVMSGIVMSRGSMYVLSGKLENGIATRETSIFISSGGTANSTLIAGKNNVFQVYNGGVANDTIMFSSDGHDKMDLFVSSGGTVNRTVIVGASFGADGSNLLHICDGGEANDTKIDGGRMFISSGGIANNTVVHGFLSVGSGGVANSTMLNNGVMHISSGGTANNIIANSCLLRVSNGGTATNIIENGGFVQVADGANVTFIANSFSGKIIQLKQDGISIHSGTTAIDTTLVAGGSMCIFSGGTAKDVTVCSGGELFISSGGKITGRIVLLEGKYQVKSGAILDFDLSEIAPGAGARINDLSRFPSSSVTYTITVNAEQAEGIYKLAENVSNFTQTISVVNTEGKELGTLTVGESTSVYDSEYTLTLSEHALLLKIGETVSPSPYTSDGLILRNATVTIESGDTFHETVIGTSGGLIINSKGYAEVTVINCGSMFVSDSGTADRTTVLAGGKMYISSGGKANGIDICNSGSALVSSGGTVTGISVNPGGELYISSSGTALGLVGNGGYIQIEDGAEVTFASNTFSGVFVYNSVALHSGTTAINTVIDNRGKLFISSGGTANNTIFGKNGSMLIYSGGVANSTTAGWGSMFIYSGGTANHTVNVSKDFWIYISDGGMAIDTLLCYDGSMTVSSGGTANSTTINERGKMQVSSGGTACNVILNDGGELSLTNGAVASGITINPGANFRIGAGMLLNEIVENGGWIEVSKGAAATFVSNTFSGLVLTNGGQSATVHSGTTAVSTTISSGSMVVYKGGIALETTIFRGKDRSLYVSSGGTAINTTINSGGRLAARERGAVYNNTIVNSGGSFNVGDGVQATGIVENGGYVSVSDSANATFVSHTFRGLVLSNTTATVHSGTTAVETTIDSFGRLYVYSGGSADSTTVNPGGGLYISSGGTGTGIIASNGARLEFDVAPSTYIQGSYDGSAFEIKDSVIADYAIHTDCRLNVCNGGTAESLVVNDAGQLIVSSGGTAANVAASSGAYLGFAVATDTYIQGTSGGSAFEIKDASVSDYTVNNGYLSVFGGGKANDIIINSGGSIFITGEAVVNNTIVNSGGSVFVSSGGTATEIMENGGFAEVQDGAEVTFVANILNGFVLSNWDSASLHSGTTANSTSICDEGKIVVFNGGFAERTEINGGSFVASSGGIANLTTINQGYFDVFSGGTGNSTIVNSDGHFNIAFGGVANNTIINNGSYVFCSGEANNTIVNGGRLYVSSDGKAINTTINSNGVLYVSDGGEANNTTVNSGCNVQVSYQGIVNGIEIKTSGQLDVNYYGKLTGKMVFEDGAVVSMNENAVLDFDLTQTAAGAEALVNDLSIIQGTPLYTLTVDDDLKPGNYAYVLADGAENFVSTISVVNTVGEELGVLAVGKTLKVGYDDYTLKLTGTVLSVSVESPDLTPIPQGGTPDQVSWEATGAKQYIVEYTTDNFEHVIQVVTIGTATDMLELPAGTYQWRVKADDNSEWAVGDTIISETESNMSKVIQAVEDGNDDLFFASTNGTWENIYYAQNVGSINDWNGTNDIISASGKGRIQNLFFGSADPNVLCLTDGENGDAIFVDDVYTDLPESIAEAGQVARLYKIKEIRAGAGNDIVDMTSQRFEYTGDGLTIRGGAGNDTIWANKGDNRLFGDAGNDRIVGASGNDVIAGGIGNDRMHGGGGNDVFTFCENWGVDNVEQLATGSVTLWFAEGSMDNWDEAMLTYTDGNNIVKVSGVAAEKVTLKFGDDGSEQFALLTSMGAFFDATTERIFEESGKGMLANL